MKKLSNLLIVIVLPFLSGCLSFVDSSDVNLQPDKYFTQRNFIAVGKTAYAQDISGLVGRIAYKDINGTYQFMNVPVLENGKKPTVKAVESAYSYSSKIDKGYSATISLAVITSDVSGKTATDYELRDVATATLDEDGEPRRTQFAEAAEMASAPTNRPWYWVRSAVLADLRQQQSVNLNGQTTVTGSGFSANGQIYDNPSAAQWVPLVSIDPVPMNTLADNEVTIVTNNPPVPSTNNISVEFLKPHYVLPRPVNEALVPAIVQ